MSGKKKEAAQPVNQKEAAALPVGKTAAAEAPVKKNGAAAKPAKKSLAEKRDEVFYFRMQKKQAMKPLPSLKPIFFFS